MRGWCCAPAAAEDGTPCAAVRMRLLYLDETEAPAVTERTAQLPLRDGETCTRCGAPEVAFTGTGCDLRQAVSVTPAAGEPVVLTTVTADLPGRVRLDGVDWNARCATPGDTLTPGQRCRVTELHSTLLIVEPVLTESRRA